MNKIPDFVPEDHSKIFQQWLIAVCRSEKRSPASLHNAAARWITEASRGQKPEKQTVDASELLPSPATLKRIRKGLEFAGEESGEKIRVVWNFMRDHAVYPRYYPGTETVGLARITSNPTANLGAALGDFFLPGPRGHRYTNERIQKMLVGQYVMYRQDFEFATRKHKQPKCIRASRVDIWPAGEMALFSETQDYQAQPKTRRPAHYQKNTGVLFPYGDFVIGLMNVEAGMSFKCVVINDILSFAEPGDEPTGYFSGKMLVASDRGLLPSQLFFCRRSEDIASDHNGFYEYEEVDEEVSNFLSTRTFRDDFNPTY